MMIIIKREFINDEAFERLTIFKYLGATFSDNWDYEEEGRTRVGFAKITYLKLKNILLQRTLPVDQPMRPILLYGVEAWDKIEAFEIWTEHTSNDDVLHIAGVKRELLSIVKQQKTFYLDHILKYNRDILPKLIGKDIMEGKR